jgi:methyl-accepting chemotaxis protein
MLHNLSFKRKIGLLVGVTLVGMSLFSTLSFFKLRDSIVQGRKAQLVSAMQSAHSIVAAYQQLAASGGMSVEQAQKAAKDALRLSRYGDTGSDYFYIWATNGDGVMHPFKREWDGQPMLGKVKDTGGVDVVKAIVDGALASKTGFAFVPTNFPRPGKTEPVPKLQYVALVKDWNWIVGSGVYMDDVDALVRQTLIEYVLMSAGVVIVVGGIAFAVRRSVLQQIGGDPMEALQAMRSVARGDLSARVSHHAEGSVLGGLATMIESLRRTVAEVRLSTDSIATASGQIAAGNHDLSSRTEQTSSNLQQTASSMEELTGTVAQTSDSARRANELATLANAAASRGGQVVDQVVGTMQDINASSRRIEDIIGVIDGIAFQTNILALNAAVEAARAGEQGRGFAVVAGEVRSLAQRSAAAAKEIKSLISASVEKVHAGSSLVNDAGATMKDIVERVNEVSTIIGDITHAAHEQSSGIGMVNEAVAQLDQMTQQNAALVEESAAAAQSLKEQAQRLAGVVQVFRLETT